MVDLLINFDWNIVSTFLKDIFIPITSITFSSFAFYNSLTDKRSKKFNLSVLPISNNIEEWYVNRTSKDNPDRYHQYPLRCIFPVLITNNSSLPITIISFQLTENHEIINNRYVEHGSIYEVQVIDEIPPIDLEKIINSGDTVISFNKTISENDVLPLPTTIKPFEAIVTELVFGYRESIVGPQFLYLKTSRGDWKQKILVSKQQGLKNHFSSSPQQ